MFNELLFIESAYILLLIGGKSFARFDGAVGIDVTLNSDILVSGIVSLPFEEIDAILFAMAEIGIPFTVVVVFVPTSVELDMDDLRSRSNC